MSASPDDPPGPDGPPAAPGEAGHPAAPAASGAADGAPLPAPVGDPSPGTAPEPRASDRDREQAAERLRTAAGDGQLTVDELDERLGGAYAAVTRRDLEGLTADLVPVGDASPEAGTAGGMPVRGGEGGDGWIVSVMGGAERRGRWRLAPKVRVVNVMGGSDLDLTDAELSAGVTEMTVVSVMGGAEIRVPEGVHVEASKVSIMGGSDIRPAEHDAPPDAPVLRLRLISIMGGSEVTRGPKPKSRRERRLERKQERIERRDEHRSLHGHDRHHH